MAAKRKPDPESKPHETDPVRMGRDLVHDLNNSLAAIAGYADFLTMDLPENSPERDFAEKIYKATQEAQERLRVFRLSLPV